MKIKKVKHIKTIHSVYKNEICLFHFKPPIEYMNKNYEYLCGGYYNQNSYPQVALYESDKNGKITNSIPVMLEEGIPTYQELFQFYGYTLI